MSLRILILGLAVAICALWPQGLVLCLGEPGHVEIEPGGAPCCPAEHHESGPAEDVPHDDCADCRDFESPELRLVTPAPAVAIPAVTIIVDLPNAAPTAPDGDRPPSAAPDELRNAILVV